MKRSAKREQFLKDVLVTAVESNGYTPWFAFDDYNPDAGTVTVWHDKEDDGKYSDGPYKVDIDKIAHGLKLFRDDWKDPPAEAVEKGWRTPASKLCYAYQMIVADDTNGDDGDFDVTTADAVMQWAVLGEEIYA